MAIVDPYKELPFLKNQRLNFNNDAPFTPSFVMENLTLSSDPAGMYASRVQGRHMLLENPARDSRMKRDLDEKREKRRAEKEKRRLGIIGKREAREKGVWKFDEAQAKFDLFLPIHHLWMGYMSELLGLAHASNPALPPTADAMPSSSSMHPKLVKADFHGSIMTVRQSKNPCLVGLSGIVFHETENVFKVVTSKDIIKTLPKQNSIFAFAVPFYSTLPVAYNANAPLPVLPYATAKLTVLDKPHIEFELHGNQFRFRSADRAGRKFKHKETIEL